METRGLFITGTDTNVGKTYVAAMIARQLRASGIAVGAYKPACSGAVVGGDGRELWPDIEELSQSIGGCYETDRICPQRFRAALAPPVAARLEGRTVDAQLLRDGARWWLAKVNLLLVEGVGGLLCPLTEHDNVADLVSDLGFPLIIVGRLGLGTINHTLLTLEAAQRRRLPVAGVILNAATSGEPAQPACRTGGAADTNPTEIAARIDVPLLAVLSHNAPAGLLGIDPDISIDWMELASM